MASSYAEGCRSRSMAGRCRSLRTCRVPFQARSKCEMQVPHLKRCALCRDGLPLAAENTSMERSKAGGLQKRCGTAGFSVLLCKAKTEKEVRIPLIWRAALAEKCSRPNASLLHFKLSTP